MDDKIKVVDLPKSPDKIAANVEWAERNMEMLVRSAQSLAKVRRANYLAYINEGFSPEQALELCVK